MIDFAWASIHFRETGSTKEKTRPERPQVTTDREKSYISMTFLKEGRQSLRKGTTLCNTSLNKRIRYSTTGEF